ncbi:hypothetical protein RN001_012972 [Aquatica leii]|uniref:SIAH-type domain-containing protein n=1 Tax=Aquatica leii TaxID=1421715 RepID=A0AAN7NZB6_9COLE|nr:hypothetical protein RN001_012972 [Aquatica leii]
MTTKQSVNYILPIEIATSLICNSCNEYLSCGPVTIQNKAYICGRCHTGEGILQLIFEAAMTDFSFPCKYDKNGCEEKVVFNYAHEHEIKCLYRLTHCPVLCCPQQTLFSQLHDHFKNFHSKCILKNNRFKLDLLNNKKQIFMMSDNDCIVLIKYNFTKADRCLQLHVAPIIETKNKRVNRYKLHILNGLDLDNSSSISLSQKLCHLYNSESLETGQFDVINVNDYLAILNYPATVHIQISLLCSVSSQTFISCKTDEIASELDEVIEENAREVLEKYAIKNCYPIYVDTKVNKMEDFFLPCQWKGCTHFGKKLQILKHQDECKFKLYVCPFLENCDQDIIFARFILNMTTEGSPKYILPDKIATTLICNYCHGYLSCGPIKIRQEMYACGHCVTNGGDEVILPRIFENFLTNFVFPCKYYKEGCKKTVQFNDTQKHESKCSYRKISCPKLNCVETILALNLYNHFQKHHLKQIVENFQFRIDLKENDTQNLIIYESDCIVVIKYCYTRATNNLRLSIAPVVEKFQTVDKYKLQICNENEVDNDISFSQQICHLYNNQYLETGNFDYIILSDYLSILNNPKALIIKIFLIYSNNTSPTTETLSTNNTGEFAPLNDVDEENAKQILQKCIVSTESNREMNFDNTNSGSVFLSSNPEGFNSGRKKPTASRRTNSIGFLGNTNTNAYSHRPETLVVEKPKDLVVPCQWKGCKHSDEEQKILKHQDECEFKLYICPFLADCEQSLHKFNSSFFNHLETHEEITMEPTPKYILPDEIAKKMICSYCHGYLSCGPIKMQKGSHVCGRCNIKGEDEGILPHIFEIFMANFTFPCKHYKEGCTKTVLFNDTQKHESKCSHRIIICPELICTDEILIMNLYDHFRKHHLSSIIENCQLKLDLNENCEQNLLIYESDCAVVIKYRYSQATKSLQLSVAPVNEKVGTVDKYKLQICNGDDVDNNINLSLKLCHLYNYKHLEAGEFENVNLNDYLGILNYPKVVIIKIFFKYSNSISVTTETLIASKTDEIAALDDLDEENASEKLQKIRHSMYGYKDNNDSNTVVPCQWKDCKKSDEKKKILKHQDECEFKLYICPFLEDCEEGLYKFNSFFNHLTTHGQYCSNPNKISILLYNPNTLYRKEKVYNYFTILNRDVVRITCTIGASGDWRFVCSSSVNIKVNVYFSHKHCRLIFKEEEKSNQKCVEYQKYQMPFSGCFVDYPRLNAVLKIETC